MFEGGRTVEVAEGVTLAAVRRWRDTLRRLYGALGADGGNADAAFLVGAALFVRGYSQDATLKAAEGLEDTVNVMLPLMTALDHADFVERNSTQGRGEA
jgi:hypothetical protein